MSLERDRAAHSTAYRPLEFLYGGLPEHPLSPGGTIANDVAGAHLVRPDNTQPSVVHCERGVDETTETRCVVFEAFGLCQGLKGSVVQIEPFPIFAPSCSSGTELPFCICSQSAFRRQQGLCVLVMLVCLVC